MNFKKTFTQNPKRVFKISIKQGVPVPIIRDVMAHSDVKTTMRYVHTAEEQIKNAMAVLNSYN